MRYYRQIPDIGFPLYEQCTIINLRPKQYRNNTITIPIYYIKQLQSVPLQPILIDKPEPRIIVSHIFQFRMIESVIPFAPLAFPILRSQSP